jgi:glycosyltransferase involved in cell wall biosynthesis
VSEDLKRFMLQEGFAADRVRVIYNGIATGPAPTTAERQAFRAGIGIPPDAIVVGSIARLDPVKHLESLIEAIRILEDGRQVMALIVGDGPERARLEALAAAGGVQSRVRFTGYRADARDWLRACDMYVNCSTSEGVSLTILEAMAASLPVIVTAVGGTPEVVTADCGLLIPPRDARALAGAVGQLAADPEGARARGAAGRARVEALFTIERMVASYADVYRELDESR